MMTVFVARASSTAAGNSDEKKALLHTSLDYTESMYVLTYGDFDKSLSERIVFILSSNKPLPASGVVSDTIHRAMERACQENRAIRIVANGHDGLTTNMTSFVKLFDQYTDVSLSSFRLFILCYTRSFPTVVAA